MLLLLTLTPGSFVKPANQIEACDFGRWLSSLHAVGLLYLSVCVCVLSEVWYHCQLLMLKWLYKCIWNTFRCTFMCTHTLAELQRCVSQWQCLYWALAGYWHQVSGDLCGSRLAGISLDCIKGELHDTVATRVLYLLAPASQLHTHRNTPPGTLWVTLTQMSLCQCCPNSSDKMERIREREGQMSGRKQARGRKCSSGCLKLYFDKSY